MGKRALLIGFDTYQVLPCSHLNSPALENLRAIAQILESEVGQFLKSEINLLINPDAQQVRQAIEYFSSRCRPSDRQFLYICGLGLIDPKTQQAYLGAYDTQPANLLSTGISSEFLQAALGHSQSHHQLVVLDVCWQPGIPKYSASLDWQAMSIAQLGSSERAVLLVFNPEAGWTRSPAGLSVCAHYLVEGISTGLADIEADGFISASDLYQYLTDHLHVLDTPTHVCLNASQNSDGIRLFELPGYQPEAEYRCSVAEYVAREQGIITDQSRQVLDFLRQQIGLSVEEGQAIEASVLKPYQETQARLQRYEQAFTEVIQLENPPNQSLRRWLKHLQQALELSYEDTIRIETRVVATYGATRKSASWRQSPDSPAETPTTKDPMPAVSRELNHNGKSLTD